jgi:Flp pilus assembly protein TadG
MTQQSTRALIARRAFTVESGATLVEFAVVFILLMSLVLGIMGFGHFLYVYHFVNHAAKTATRWAAVNGYNCNNDSSCNGTNGMNSGPAKDTDIQAYVLTLAPQGIDSTKITTTVPCGFQGGTTCNASKTTTPAYCKSGDATFTAVNDKGCTVQVQVAYAFNFIFPLMPAGPSPNTACGSMNGFCVSATSEMVIAH